jgi:hypothetical protein
MTMACSNERSRRSFAGDERYRRAAAAFFLSSLLLVAASASAQFAEQEVFATPSMEIECTFTSAGPELSCDRFGPRHLRFVLGSSGPAHMFNVTSDEECCTAENVLEFGMTWSQGPFTCRWARSGLICNREHHGFHIGKRIVMAY